MYNSKKSFPLTREEVEKIIMGDYGFLLKLKNDFYKIFYHHCISRMIRPRVVVDYEREPFTMDAGHVRVTFDRNIRAGVEGMDIFNSEMAMIEAMEGNKLVLEVKYTEFLPNLVRKILPPKAAEYSAVSKYILGCNKTLYKRHSYC